MMGRSRMIRLDRSACSVVVICEACPHWRAFAFTLGEAHVSASSHEERVHPDDYRARNARLQWERRHADTSANV